jgi:hypothetical protein
MAVPGGRDDGVDIRFREGDTARIFATLKATKVNGWILD